MTVYTPAAGGILLFHGTADTLLNVMHKGEYPLQIPGYRFLQQRELPVVSTCWDYQTTGAFTPESARRLFAELPEDLELSFLDPTPHPGDTEPWWVVVRRVGHGGYFFRRVRHGFYPPDKSDSLEKLVSLFMASPLVRSPQDPIESFTISSIQEHQRYERLKGKALPSDGVNQVPRWRACLGRSS